MALSIFDDVAIYPGKTLDQPYAGAVRLAAEGYAAKSIETRRTRIRAVPSEIVVVAGHTAGTRKHGHRCAPRYDEPVSPMATSTARAAIAALPLRWCASWSAGR